MKHRGQHQLGARTVPKPEGATARRGYQRLREPQRRPSRSGCLWKRKAATADQLENRAGTGGTDPLTSLLPLILVCPVSL